MWRLQGHETVTCTFDAWQDISLDGPYLSHKFYRGLPVVYHGDNLSSEIRLSDDLTTAGFCVDLQLRDGGAVKFRLKCPGRSGSYRATIQRRRYVWPRSCREE